MQRRENRIAEVRILTGQHQIAAETAAGRLRAEGIAARVERDNEALLGVTGSSSVGTFSVLVADADAERAREALKLRSVGRQWRQAEDSPFSAQAVLIGVVVLAVALLALYLWSLTRP